MKMVMMIMIVVVVVVVMAVVIVTSLYEDVTSVELNKKKHKIKLLQRKKMREYVREKMLLLYEQGKTSYIAV